MFDYGCLVNYKPKGGKKECHSPNNAPINIHVQLFI